MTSAKVIPGAESFFYPGNSIGILICHGFNGTPQSVRYIGESLAAKGFTVYAPRLKGHGTNEREMETVHYQEWIQNIEAAYRKLKHTCTHVFALGQSMGGTLVLDLASKVPCDGILTINAALQVPEYKIYRNQNAPRFIAEGAPDIKDNNTLEITYDQVPITAVNQLLTIMDQTIQHLENISCPALLFHSPEDHVVPAQCSNQIYDSIRSHSKKLISLENSYHVASLDFDKELIVEHAYQFIVNNSKGATIAS
ncbi:alpha/beta hydrolase [Peribacillus sp. NPDC097675]|uniref:alpha/beta hydrolase n=1 Tax=Peribacillus sp. NPDC097675 TaxID=3390618 RepID=UPI003CFFA385